MIAIQPEDSWESRAIQQLRARFIEEPDNKAVATFDSDDYHLLMYEDKREWFTFLITTEGYGQ